LSSDKYVIDPGERMNKAELKAGYRVYAMSLGRRYGNVWYFGEESKEFENGKLGSVLT